MKLIKNFAFGFLFLCFLSNAAFAQVTDPYINDLSINNADLLIKQGNFQAALNSVNDYIEFYPKDPQGYLKRAMVYGILGQNNDKAKDIQYATYLNPYAYLYINESSRTKISEKKKYDYVYSDDKSNFSKSPIKNEYYQIYLKDNLGLHSQDSLIEKAIFYLSQNDLSNTELILAQITPSDNILGIYYDLKGLIELKKDNLDTAIDFFTKSIENSESFPLAYHNRAIAYKLNGNYDKAKEDLLTAVSMNEDISVFFFTLAKLSERLDNPDQAISYYKEAIDKNPNYLEARTNFSILQKTLGNYEEAILDLIEVSEMMEDDYNNHFINGGIFLTYGDYERSIDEFNIYLDENSDDSDALFNRGLAKILSGEKIDGCDDIQYSIDLEDNPKRTKILSSFCPSY